MRLIDADTLKKALHMGDECEECEQDTRQCQYDAIFSRMDVCSMLDGAPTVGGWISVEDRMPCENPWESEWVLVWFGEQSALRTEAPLPGKWNPNERTWWVVGFGDKYEGLNLKITHWMPLPEPPEEEKQDEA